MSDIPSRQEQALAEAQRSAPIRPGHVLGNGAVIIDCKERRHLPHAVEYDVLAVHPGFQPYVIWIYVVGVEQKADGSFGTMAPYCFSGHYFRKLQDAISAWEDTHV